ncbi:MAG TPA: STAS domain-containing protein [Acidimicrobiales bacterium]|nr:STAS domain-containing protein [Acidimicrobiales bacterium]
MDLKIKVSDASGAAVVSVTGELAAETAPAFGKALDHLSSSARPVMVDLEGATGMDGLGLSVLVQAFRRLRDNDCALIVVAPPPAVRKVIDESGVEDFMPICRTIEEAAALITVLRRRATDTYDTAYDSAPRRAGPELS